MGNESRNPVYFPWVRLLEVKLLTISNKQSRQPNNNPCDSWPKTARIYVITDSFPNFCSCFQYGTPIYENQICIRIQSHRMTPGLALLVVSHANSLRLGPIWSLARFPPRISYFSPCLQISAVLSDGGSLPYYSKLCINSLCLFAFVCSSFLRTLLWFLPAPESYTVV